MNAGLHHKRKKGMYSLLTIDGETVEIDGETEETVADSIFLDSKFTADGDRIHEIKMRAKKLMLLNCGVGEDS